MIREDGWNFCLDDKILYIFLWNEILRDSLKWKLDVRFLLVIVFIVKKVLGIGKLGEWENSIKMFILIFGK